MVFLRVLLPSVCVYCTVGVCAYVCVSVCVQSTAVADLFPGTPPEMGAVSWFHQGCSTD